jgi:hypothetical protein
LPSVERQVQATLRTHLIHPLETTLMTPKRTYGGSTRSNN